MASGYEKAFHNAVQSFAQGNVDDALRLFRESSEKDTKDKALADELFAGIISAQVRQIDGLAHALGPLSRARRAPARAA